MTNVAHSNFEQRTATLFLFLECLSEKIKRSSNTTINQQCNANNNLLLALSHVIVKSASSNGECGRVASVFVDSIEGTMAQSCSMIRYRRNRLHGTFAYAKRGHGQWLPRRQCRFGRDRAMRIVASARRLTRHST